jgi:biopolymer transport protein ExbD
VRFKSRLRPTQGIPAAAMMNLVLLLVFHLVALTWQASFEPGVTSQPIAVQSDTTLRIGLGASGAIRMEERDVADGELPALIAGRSRSGGSVRVEVGYPAGISHARLADVLRALREAGASEILVAPSEEADR